MLNKKGYKNMFNLKEFLNTAECTVDNLRVLLQNGIKTVKLFDEECDCFGENTIDIEKALAEIDSNADDGFMCINNEQHYWFDECGIQVGSSSYNVYFTAEKALICCLNYTADWCEGEIENIVTKQGILNSSYISDKQEVERLQNTVIEYTDWNDVKTNTAERDRLIEIVYNNADDIKYKYY